MKKLLLTILFTLVLSGGVSANEDKDFYISCSAKGNLVIGYSGQTFSEIIVDEYKITIGKGDIIQGNRAIKSIQLVNTNANVPNDFYLHRNPYDDSISLSNKIIGIGTSFIDEKKLGNHFRLNPSEIIILLDKNNNQKNKSNFFGKLCNLRNHITEVKDLEKLICFMANFYYITEAVKQKNQSS